MEKETYIAPTIEVMNIEPVEMIASSVLGVGTTRTDEINSGTKFRDGGDDFWW